MTNSIKVFPTDNFQLASFLLSKGCRIVSIDKQNPQRVVFNFEDSEERKELTEEFLAYQGLIEPHRFFSAQKDLKQMIYQNK